MYLGTHSLGHAYKEKWKRVFFFTGYMGSVVPSVPLYRLTDDVMWKTHFSPFDFQGRSMPSYRVDIPRRKHAQSWFSFPTIILNNNCLDLSFNFFLRIECSRAGPHRIHGILSTSAVAEPNPVTVVCARWKSIYWQPGMYVHWCRMDVRSAEKFW